MEKTGSLLLTPNEYFEIMSGTVPKRISDNWGLSLDQILDIINNREYELMDGGPPYTSSTT
jgi:hypothetical protein